MRSKPAALCRGVLHVPRPKKGDPMITATLDLIPAPRRNALFNEIARLVDEAEAIDRSLDHMDEAWAVDDTLEEIVESINDEIRLARKSHRRLATILKLGDTDSVA